MRSLVPMILLTLASACAEAPSLTIKLRGPAALADLSAVQGTLSVELLDGNTGLPLEAARPTPVSLAGRQRLFDQLDLVQDRLYRVRVKLVLDAADLSCNKAGGGRIVGLSPLFRHDPEVGSISVYVACADSFNVDAKMSKERLYHSATWLPAPRPHGRVMVVGGGRLNLSPNPEVTKATLLDSLEAYDPGRGTFETLPGKLAQPRIYHRAVPAGEDTLVVTGGVDGYLHKGKTYMLGVDLVERVRGGQVTGLHSLRQQRGHHSAAMLSPSRLLLAGGIGAAVLPIKGIEVYDVKNEKREDPSSLQLGIARVAAATVAYDGGQRVLISGGRGSDANGNQYDVIYCDAGSCPCGKPPCLHKVASFSARLSMTATLVQCEAGGGGAIYLTGGAYNIPLTESYLYYKDIHCFDTRASSFRKVGQLKVPRTSHTATLVRGPNNTRRLLVAGGSSLQGAVQQSAEIFPVGCSCSNNIDTKEIRLLPLNSDRRVGHTATLLPDGSVLLVGGAMADSTERFVPDLE